MKLSPKTIAVLKNFASINSSLLVKKGHTQATVCPSNRILVEALLEEDFPRDFGIYDLSKFLSIMSLFKDPVLEFEDTYLTISSEGDGGVRSVKYFYTNPEFITSKADKKVKMPDLALTFDLSEEDAASILKAASVIQAPDMCVVSDKGELGIRVCDKKNPTSNSWYLNLNTETDINFCFWFAVDTLKLLPGDYSLSIAKKSVARFSGNEITYWVAMDSDSTYGA
jgi:hypothetical protein